ncbi:hypothetical protein L1987_85953 [Smallanthus sonchifolius]|uniref:Uncharacterized protein n=1 Tax=Smallanthus sonchifolius TaxID=185202 RepID=A0ACB8XXZ5_9ASTR|nr:hypothetical protein L1987_85953 [Smallanthus sonchifolius]
MDRDFFLNAGLQFEPPSQLMTTIDPILRPIWEKSDQYSQFEPAMSSPVSNSTVSNDIGKMGCDFPAAAMTVPPLNSSPPKLNLPIMDHFVKENLPRVRNPIALNPNLQLLAADPGFAERAAKFSCFGSRSLNGRTEQLGLNSNKSEAVFESNVSPATGTGNFPRVLSSPVLKTDRSPVGFEENMKLSRLSASAANSNEESYVSEQIPSRKDSNSRKRKGVSTRKEGEVVDDSKRQKKTEQENNGKTNENTKPPEPPKDYIHVRARRGQATDSHSLAERVRREKISERMNLLQNLVPNCNKVTGKALMLDEIINYVQSLQRQVEFLSMKLATVNPSLDFATNDIASQNASQQTSTVYQHQLFNESNQSIHEFAEPFLHFPGFVQDELQSIVRMGYGENLALFHTTVDQPSNLKTQL